MVMGGRLFGANTGAESQKRSRVPKDEIWIDYG